MERVLLDGTTLVSARRLLSRQDPPTALNFWSLSLLIECLILHEEVIVLDTLPDDSTLQAAAQPFGGLVRVERHSIRSLVDRYIEMEFPELSGLADVTSEDVNHYYFTHYKSIDKAKEHLLNILERRNWQDPAMTGYLDTLN